MPKVSLKSASVEKEEADSVLCKTCTAPAAEEHEPYCMSCAIYWEDCRNGLWDDDNYFGEAKQQEWADTREQEYMERKGLSK